MTRITQEQFKNDFKRNGVDVAIDVKNLDPETEEKLKKAGVSQAALNEIAGIDGKISGDKEYTLLYKKVDSFEKDKPTTPGYFETTDAKNAPTKSGQVYEALKGEVDRNLNIARAQGVLQNSPAVPGNDPV